MRILTLLTLAVTLAAGKPDGERYFTNPVFRADWPDPTVWRVDKHFYSLATGADRRILQSDDLVSWSRTPCWAQRVEDTQEARRVGAHFWAPDVVKIGDWWNLYLALHNRASDSGIALFRSRSPLGPFHWAGVLTHSKTNGIRDNIDPEVVIDPADGRVWLFFGSVGGIFRVQLTADGTALASDAAFIHVAGLDIRECPDRSRVFEGAYLYRRGGWWYLFASSGFYKDNSYRMVVGRSASLTGEFLDKQGRKMTEGYTTELMASGKRDDFYGPGHNGEIFTDATGQDYILYHCHSRSGADSDAPRFLMLQRLFWDADGWPYVHRGKPAGRDRAPRF